MKTLSFLFIATIILFASTSNAAYSRAGVDERHQAVNKLTKDLSCTDSSVCLSAGIGSKPCGGPWRYHVYSSATTDAEKLKAAVADLNAYEAGYNQQEGIMSDCSLAPLANPSCVNSKCVDLNAAQ